jgi:FMN phosphatase YigB (HAD superfamily)
MTSPNLEFLTDGARHLICIPYSVDNLHEMARQLSVKTCWFHKDHYDIPKRRISEIEAKCRIISSREIVRIINEPLDLG